MTKKILTNLIASLKDAECKKIVVVGNQRSGTRIATHIISQETNLKRVFEEEFVELAQTDKAISSDTLYERFYANNEEYVLQSPFLTHQAHLLNADAIIFLTRNHKDLKASAQRVGWIEEQNEKQYQSTIKEMESVGMSISFSDPLLNKYSWILRTHFWNNYQNTNLKAGGGYTIDFNDFESHSQFISKNKRDLTNEGKGFFPNQITENPSDTLMHENIGEELSGIQDRLIKEQPSSYIKPALPKNATLTKTTLTLNLCLCLIWAYKYYRYNENAEFGQYYRTQDFFHDLLNSKEHKSIVKNYTRLKYWDLLVPMPTSPTEVIYKKGWWGITENGVKFVQREIGLPKYALVHNDFAYKHITNPFVMLEDLLKEYNLDYDELLKP